MRGVPSSVYRLQLTESFTIRKATALLPYLKSLGVEGVYCSPYFEAYSPHGYDVTDPNKLNPKLASEKEYARFCDKLHSLGMFHLADVVPNHMGIKGDNVWWQDVLEKGPHSKYAKFFDLDWSEGKILVPLLGEDRVVEEDHYKLVPWWTSATKTSYRRFFTINELIGIRIEDPEVLREHHRLLFRLLKEKKIDGIRVDHPDGLLDPRSYFQRLRKKHKGLIFVEKILGFGEELPESWEVDGTVGYEFAHMLTGVFVEKNEDLTGVYHRFIGRSQNFDEMLYENKKSFLQKEMQGDIDNLAKTLPAPYGKEKLVKAITEILAAFPVYRSYIPPKGPVPKRDVPYIQTALREAREKKPLLQNTFDFLEEVFSLKKPHREFILKFQQLSAPAMAKGFEDITLYQYNRLLALNDVGFDPARHGVTVEEFHAFCKKKQKNHPLGLLATSTHDSKRSMDARMMLATLSQMPMEWEKALLTFSQLNEPHKIGGFPDRNAEYFLYQMILSVWPSKPTFKRLWTAFQKSIREAREQTDWQHPNTHYEMACEHFLKKILEKGSSFLEAFNSLSKSIRRYGRWNSLSSAAIKLAAPGIIDLYEGCENFRYTLVDPDNRTPVNFKKKPDIKAELHKKALHYRQEHKSLFLEGDYIPLEVKGEAREHVIAFMRRKGRKTLVVAVCRFFPTLSGIDQTKILLPMELKRGEELFTGRTFEGMEISADELFEEAPFAWILSE